MRVPISSSGSPFRGVEENVRLVKWSPDAQAIPNLGHKSPQLPAPLFNSGLILRLRSFAAELLDCQDFREEPFDGEEALGPCKRCLEGILYLEVRVGTRVRPGNGITHRFYVFPTLGFVSLGERLGFLICMTSRPNEFGRIDSQHLSRSGFITPCTCLPQHVLQRRITRYKSTFSHGLRFG